LTPTDSDEFDALRTKELNNGRLAMLGVAGIVAQELVNGKTILENFAPVAV
jgi:light-harvesting complex I chlorophyll a/b binding protein 1